MMNDYQKDFLKEKFSNMELSEKLGIAREFAINANYEVPMEMYEIDCLCEGMRPLEIIEKYGNLDTSCSYYMHDGYRCVSMDDAKLEEWCDETLDEFLDYKDPDDFECWDYEEFCEWISDEYGEDIYDIFSLDDDFPYSSDCHTHAEQFARRWDVDLETSAIGYKKHFPGLEQKFHVFKCKLINRDCEEYEFELAKAKDSANPDMYHVLAGLIKYDPCTYEDFCAELGYAGGEDSLETYHNVKKEWEAVLRLFGPENGKCMEELRDIC